MEIRLVNLEAGCRKVDTIMLKALKNKLQRHKICLYFCGMMAIYHLAMHELQVAAIRGPERGIVQPPQLAHKWDQRSLDVREATDIMTDDLHLMEAVAKKGRRIPGRRIISSRGAGSSPPLCHFKCGKCTSPCVSVLVPINPRSHTAPLEYYPEVWRCRCGNRFYIP